MFDKLKDVMHQATDMAKAMKFDPSKFNDPVAEQIDWRTISRSSTNFKTHKLVTDGVNRAEFKPSLNVIFFSLIFIGVAVGFLIYWLPQELEQGISFTAEGLMPFIFPLIFGGVGVIFFLKYRTPIVFDKLTGAFWKGKNEPDHHTNLSSMKNGASLEEIHALQLLRRYNRKNSSSSSGSSSSRRGYYVYELNIVLKDGTRKHVLAHGGRRAMHDDASELAEFLGVPLWAVT